MGRDPGGAATGDGFFRRLPTEVVVRTRPGRELRGFAEYAKGDPWSPKAMTDDELIEKAKTYLDGILPDAQIKALATAIFALEQA